MPQAEKSQVVLAGPQGQPLIQKTPGVCGGDACIRNTRIMVWLLVSLKRQGASDDHCRQNPEEVDRAIKENEDDED